MLCCGCHSRVGLPPSAAQPHEQIAHRAGLEQLKLRCSQSDPARLPAAVVSDQPGNRRFDPPAIFQQLLAERAVVERLALTQIGVIGRNEDRPMARAIGLWVATLIPQRAIATLSGQKTEEDTVVAAMRIDTRADDAVWTGAARLRTVEAEIGNAEAPRVAPAARRDQGNHLGLTLTPHVHLGARWATPAGLIHNQVRRQRHLGRLELTHNCRGGLTIGGAAGEGYTGANTGCGGANHGIDAKHGWAALVLAQGGLQVNRALTTIGNFVVGQTFANAPVGVGSSLVSDDLADRAQQHVHGCTLVCRERRQDGSHGGHDLLCGADDRLEALLAFVRGVPARRMAQCRQVEGREYGGHGEAGRPGLDQPDEQVPEQMDDADGWRGRTGHREGIHDLGCGGGRLRVNAVKKRAHIGKQGHRGRGCHPGMEAIEGAVVGSGAKQGQANKPADDQVGGE